MDTRSGIISRDLRRGNAVSIVKGFEHALWMAQRTIFRPQMHEIAGFCIYSLIFSGVISPDFDRIKRPPVYTLTHTPISVWLASVPIIPVLRNDHRSRQHDVRTSIICSIDFESCFWPFELDESRRKLLYVKDEMTATIRSGLVLQTGPG